MLAGVLLGPSLLGWIAPRVQAWLFPTSSTAAVAGHLVGVPHPSMAIPYVLAQVGVALYMFLVGLQFDLTLVRQQGRPAVAVSLAGIAVPLALGGAAAGLLLRQPGLIGAGLSHMDAAFFFALSLSITAFPVLARIVEEHGIAQTTLGTLAIAAAATNDAVAWCLLAILLGLVGGTPQGPVLTLGATIVYVALMLSLGRVGLRAWARRVGRPEEAGGAVLGMALLVVLVGSWVTTVIGIHLIFGAFVAGVAMPRGRVALALRGQLESVTTALFLPIFFVYSGLNTQITLLATPPCGG